MDEGPLPVMAFVNDDAEDPSERLILLRDGPVGMSLAVYASGDGIHWTRKSETGDLRHTADAPPDPEARYLFGSQSWAGKTPLGGNKRGAKTTVFQAPDDRPDLEYYMMLPHAIPISDAYHGWMLGFLHPFHVDPEGKIHPSGHAYMSGTIDVSLAVSRDTVDWEQLDPDRPFIPLGRDGAFDDGMMLVGAMCEFEDRLYIYYTGWNADHGTFVDEPEPDSRAQVGLATLRLDGFVALAAQKTADGPGVLVTTPFVLSGSRLEVNADASAGQIVVEVLDVDRNVLSGFGTDSAMPLTQDGVRLAVSWREDAGLSALAGRTVRLRFTLTGAARLYAFQVLGDEAN